MKLYSKLFLCGTFALSSLASIEAQDVRFSQYYSAPLRLNPAMIGMFEGNIRVGMNYRSQWGSVLNKAYKSFAATADAKFAVGKNDYFAAGFSAMSDFAGTGNYNTTEINIGGAFHKKLNKSRRGYRFNQFESYLIAGAQIGFGQRSVNWDKLTFSNQWDPDQGNYNQNFATGETDNIRRVRTYVDANAGLMWAGSFGKRKNAYLGFSASHLNRPDVSIFNMAAQDSLGNPIGTATEKLYMRWTIHAGGEILIGPKKSPISLLPGFVMMLQGPSMEINAGLSLRYQAPAYDDFAFRMGVWLRNVKHSRTDDAGAILNAVSPDAITFLFGLDFKTFQLGLSYDLTVSSLRVSNNARGAMEVSLFYRFDRDLKRAQGCPTF